MDYTQEECKVRSLKVITDLQRKLEEIDNDTPVAIPGVLGEPPVWWEDMKHIESLAIKFVSKFKE